MVVRDILNVSIQKVIKKNNLFLKIIKYSGDDMKVDIKKLLFYIIITFLIGSFFTLFNNVSLYDDLNKAVDIPRIVFPIVWSILYLLMAISAYMISETMSPNKFAALKLYFVQLIVNSLWTLIFFGLRQYVLSFIWIILLIVLVIWMIIKFYRIRKVSGFINVPYLLWLLFASFLTLSIIILN